MSAEKSTSPIQYANFVPSAFYQSGGIETRFPAANSFRAQNISLAVQFLPGKFFSHLKHEEPAPDAGPSWIGGAIPITSGRASV
jgi:hypothetical protein